MTIAIAPKRSMGVRFLFTSIAVIALLATLNLLNYSPVSAASAAAVRAALGTVPRELPDTPSNYLSLMQGGSPGPINGNAISYADTKDSTSINLKLYAVNNFTRTIRLNLVQRDVGADLACDNYKIHFVFKGLTASEQAPNGNNIVSGRGAPGDPPDSSIQGAFSSDPQSRCTGRYVDIPLPANQMSASSLAEHTGLYTGIVTLSVIAQPGAGVTSPNRSPTFHAKIINDCASLDCARIGYPGTVGGSITKVAIYPSNLNNGNDIDFFFQPPCDDPTTANVVEWEDTDRGVVNKNQDVNSNFVNNLNYSFPPNPPGNPGPSGHTGAINALSASVTNITASSSAIFGPITYGGSGPGGASFNVTGGNIYRMRFSNVNGGNRVIFSMPYDSGGFPCGGTTGSAWHLTPTIAPGPGAGTYTPAFGDANYTNDVSNAFAAFGQARFSLGVNELAGVDAAAGSHNWDVQYKYIRGDTGTESAIFTKDKNYTGAVPAGGLFTFTNSSQVPTGSASGMRYLVGDRYYDGGPIATTPHRTPRANDAYCERLVIDGFTAGNVADSPGGWACVTLNEPPVCLPWHVDGASAIYQLDGANNPITGFGNVLTDAWVGARYGYAYSFSHSGLAASTGPINFYHNSGVPTNTQALGAYNDLFPVDIVASMGGQTLFDSMGYEPIDGFSNCAVNGNNTLTNAIIVPYYFHLKPSSTISNIPADRVSQGDPINTTINVSLPVQDDQGDLSGEAASDNEFGGRQHTWSSPTNWRIIEFRTSDINNAKAVVPKNRSGGSGDCPELNSFGIAGFSGCGIVSAGNQVFTIGDASFSYTRPAQLDPVGTNICYVSAVGSPTHTGSPAWRYSDVSCTTVVKSPKVQFLNGDLTVGRHRLTDGPPPCTPPVAGASIQATGAPSLAPPPVNIYGSWVEYGAFATGTITGFGTAAYADSGSSSHTKLMFGNTPTRGNYSYAAGCLSNPFDLIKEPDVNYIDTQATDLRLNELFSTPPYNTSAADKTGYVANNAAGTNPKDVVINQSPSPASPLDDSFGGFRARDIIIYAKKGAGTCGTAGVGGNITINTDINYAKTGYGDINELPRIILLADCNIIINDNVKRVDAWLISKQAVETCSAATGLKFFDSTVTHLDCTNQLIINGPVQADRLLLWRTHGSDLTDPVTSREAAEIYNLRPDQLLSTYARGRDAGKPHTVYQTDLPPLY